MLENFREKMPTRKLSNKIELQYYEYYKINKINAVRKKVLYRPRL